MPKTNSEKDEWRAQTCAPRPWKLVATCGCLFCEGTSAAEKEALRVSVATPALLYAEAPTVATGIERWYDSRSARSSGSGLRFHTSALAPISRSGMAGPTARQPAESMSTCVAPKSPTRPQAGAIWMLTSPEMATWAGGMLATASDATARILRSAKSRPKPEPGG